MLVDLWLLLRWDFGQTTFERTISQLVTLVSSTVYWFVVAAVLTLIVSKLT